MANPIPPDIGPVGLHDSAAILNCMCLNYAKEYKQIFAHA